MTLDEMQRFLSTAQSLHVFGRTEDRLLKAQNG